MLITIDTPGGLSSSMQEIIKAIEASTTPVICYVSPEGARAASAGAFILMACHVAAMAPATNVGASTPVGIGGVTLARKVEEDAAATMRKLAEQRGRNAELAETFVTESKSITAQEALDGNIIDLIADSERELLERVDGTDVVVADGVSTTLHTADASIDDVAMTPGVGFLHGLFDPNLAFIFFWLGLALIVLELIVPGHIFSGTLGTILLLISIASFGLLPVRLIGIALLVASVVFFVIELKVPGLGIWSIAGIASLVLGGLVLFDPAGGAQVSPYVIVPVAVFMALFFGFVVSTSPRDAAPAARAGGRGGRRPGGRRAGRRPRSRWGRARRSGGMAGDRPASAPARYEGPCHETRRARAHRRTARPRARADRRRRAGPGREPLMDFTDPVFIGTAVVLFLLILFLANAIRIVPEYQRLVVFRLGRILGVKGPGLILLIPIVDKGVKVDLREFFLEIPRQDSITKDNAPIAVDFITFYKVVDPAMSVVQVGNFAGAAQALASTTLRAVIGDIPLDDVLAKRDEINQILRAKLDEVTERWGVKVTNVEIREIIPPPSVQEAMTRQMSAERSRRAIVLEADGTKSAAITVAEGNKASAILNAEGNKQSAILTAEGERQAAILRAEGFALALKTINEQAMTADQKTMSLQYLETLKQIGGSPASKIVVPMELSGLVAGIVAVADVATDNGRPSAG